MESHLHIVLLSLGVLLATARLLGEITKQLGLTALLGEIVAGILLGPTVLGKIAPEIGRLLFPTTGSGAVFWESMTGIAVSMFLLVSGMEVNLTAIVRQKRQALVVGLSGLLLPFILGFASARFFPAFLGSGPGSDPMVFSLFIGTALCISALPVIAKILLELNLYRTDLGMLVMPAAVLQDLIGWCVFAVIMGLLDVNPKFSVGVTVGLTLLFAVLMLTVGRLLFDRFITVIQAHWTWPGGIVGFGVAATLLAASFTEWIGIHALFGAFLVGVALGDSKHMTEKARHAFKPFISYFFSPLFFASIGLKVDFLSEFAVLPVVTIVLLASAGKIGGSLVGGKLVGLSRRDSLAVGYAMNARGAMEIILGLAALRLEMISEKTFVALVIMAIVTSLMSGPLIKRVLRLSSSTGFWKYIRSSSFHRFVHPESPSNLFEKLANGGGILKSTLTKALLQTPNEYTAIGHGVAVRNIQIAEITTPRLAVGVSDFDIDIEAPDAVPIRVLFLLATPSASLDLPLPLVSCIADSFSREGTLEKAGGARNLTEFVAAVRPSSDE